MDNAALLEKIDLYCRTYRISERTFGLRSVNNSTIVGRLRENGTLTLKTLRKIETFMSTPTVVGRQKNEQVAA